MYENIDTLFKPAAFIGLTHYRRYLDIDLAHIPDNSMLVSTYFVGNVEQQLNSCYKFNVSFDLICEAALLDP